MALMSPFPRLKRLSKQLMFLCSTYILPTKHNSFSKIYCVKSMKFLLLSQFWHDKDYFKPEDNSEGSRYLSVHAGGGAWCSIWARSHKCFSSPPSSVFFTLHWGSLSKQGRYMSAVMSPRLCWYSKSLFSTSIARPSQVHVAVFFYNTNPMLAQCEWILAIIYAPLAAQVQCISIILSISKKVEKRQNCVRALQQE